MEASKQPQGCREHQRKKMLKYQMKHAQVVSKERKKRIKKDPMVVF